jgi:hypothetical protein
MTKESKFSSQEWQQLFSSPTHPQQGLLRLSAITDYVLQLLYILMEVRKNSGNSICSTIKIPNNQQTSNLYSLWKYGQAGWCTGNTLTCIQKLSTLNLSQETGYSDRLPWFSSLSQTPGLHLNYKPQPSSKSFLIHHSANILATT